MAYFSNGSEGECYRAEYCDCCTHDRPQENVFCPIWNAHLAYCHSEYGKPGAAILDTLIPMIPRTHKDGLIYKVAGPCKFFERASHDLPFGEPASGAGEGR